MWKKALRKAFIRKRTKIVSHMSLLRVLRTITTGKLSIKAVKKYRVS